MPPKLRHACERCGLEAVFERAGRFRDEDFVELLHEYFALEQQLDFAHRRINLLRERVQQLVRQRDAPVRDVEVEEIPF